MTDTVISSATREVVIGFERPFVIIGERINPTGRKLLAAEMKVGDYSRVESDALAQVAAGARMLDVNAGIPLADEPSILAETVKLVQSLVDVPLSIDSSIVEALESGLSVYQGKALVNSVTGEDEQMERVLPLVAKHGAAVVAITNDETGISEDPDVRFEVARKIVNRAADHGIPKDDIVVDPLVMPIGAMGGAGRQVMALVRRLRAELGVNTTCGASNISFGLPQRHGINAAFLTMAIASGLTSAITNPLEEEIVSAVMAADVLMGTDENCARWIAKHRQPPADGEAGRRRSGRTQGSGRQPAMTDSELRVTFTPSGRRGTAGAGSTVLDVARELGADIDSVCGGRGICGRCQVMVGSAPGVPASPSALSAPGPTETNYRGKRPLLEGHRLACAAEVCEDVVIDVPPQSQVHRQVVRKRAEVVAIDVDPVVRLHYIEVAEPTLDDASSDLGRVYDSLAEQWDLHELATDAAVIPVLQPALRAGEWKVTVSIHDGNVITGIWPGFRDVALGVAYDVGSTTVAAHLCDLTSGDVLASAGVMNPQIRFGEDLMSRVSYVMMNPGGEVALTAAVRTAMDELIGDLVAHADVSRDDILEVTVVGNPVMHHLVLGIDPTPLGGAPFALAVDKAVRSGAADIGLAVHPGARLYLLPCIAGHVGADAAAAVLSEGPHRGEAVQLLVDVGTNAEIVLGSSGRLLAASSPTGPAFEGAQISSGQRAAPGAIERVRIDPATLEPRLKVIGSDLWSDEPGFGQEIADTGVTGICGSGIIEVVAELFLAGVISQEGVIGGDNPRIVADGRTRSYVLAEGASQIRVTQNDVRAIQLAKAALYAGVKLLMDHLGVDAVDEIRLAGAFGSHIDTKYAMVLGLIPDCDLEKVSAAGNAAGTGSMMALLSREARTEIEQVATEIEKIETATEPRFQELFVGAMGIPHATDPFPQLANVVELPAPQDSSTRPERRRRRATTKGARSD